MPATYRVRGTRALDDVVQFQDATVFVEYPTSNTWEADIVLEPDRTEYYYRFSRASGAFSPWYTVTVSRTESTLTKNTAHNELDEWGVLLDTERLPDEENSAYKTRLLDVFTHRGGPNHRGLVNAIARDLGLDYTDTALIVTRKNNPSTGRPFTSLFLGISATNVHVGSTEFLISNEQQLVSPVTRIVTPAQQVVANLEVRKLDGELVKDITYDERKNEIHVHDDLGGEVVRLRYVYRVVISRMDKTLDELKTELEAVATPGGDLLFTVAVASGYGSKSAENLAVLPDTVLRETHPDFGGNEVAGLPVRWTDMRIEAVWDPEVHDYVRNWTGSLWNTKVDSAYQALVNLSKSTWGTAVADESIWSSHEFPLHGGQHIDTIYDAPLGYWESNSGEEIYDAWQVRYATLAPVSPTYKGLVRGDFQSGVGAKNHLKVVLGLTEATRDIGTTARDEVSDTVVDETVIPDGTSPFGGGAELP